MTFSLTPKQHAANAMMAGPASHILLRGGARSGKTFLIMRAVAIRSMKAGGSRHGVFRQRFNHVKNSIVLDTFPKMMKLCFPDVRYSINKTDWFAQMPDKSEIWFGGLDDKDRTEKILGQEFATVYLNEASQITYPSRNKVVTRLAQNTSLRLREYTDCNPPNMGHWLYQMYGLKLEPAQRTPLTNPDDYASMQVNPSDNLANLPEGFMTNLDALPEKDKRRFKDGEFLPMVDGALWTYDMLDKCRVTRDQLPPMKRVVVAVDPSGCSGPEDTRSDEIGIVVAGLGIDDVGYVLEDASGHYSPDGWGKRACGRYHKWGADRIVGEKNYGGAMVEFTVRTAAAAVSMNVGYKEVNATRGKQVRAEPIAALYEQGKVKHLLGEGVDMTAMEEQMCNFAASGYEGMKSPDRADAAIWALTELMLGSGYAYDFNAWAS